MQALDFFVDYPMREESTGDLVLDAVNGRISLYPFITSAVCPQCEEVETYFVDAWDTKKGTARLKSFEKGHTLDSLEVAGDLEDW